MFFSFCAPCPGSQRDKRDIRNDKVPSSSKQQSFSLRDDEEKEKEKEREREKVSKKQTNPIQQVRPPEKLDCPRQRREVIFVCLLLFPCVNNSLQKNWNKKKTIDEKILPNNSRKKVISIQEKQIEIQCYFCLFANFSFFQEGKEKRDLFYIFFFFRGAGYSVADSATRTTGIQRDKKQVKWMIEWKIGREGRRLGLSSAKVCLVCCQHFSFLPAWERERERYKRDRKSKSAPKHRQPLSTWTAKEEQRKGRGAAVAANFPLFLPLQ